MPLEDVFLTLAAMNRQGQSAAPAGAALVRHLRSIGAKAVVREDDYVDFDYSRAFEIHYGKFFRPPSKSCSRFHFFKFPIPEEPVSPKGLATSYLGFVVIWPTDPPIIGRSVILPVARRSANLKFVTAKSSVHLGPVALSVDAPPFATKDFGVAACASISTWLATEIGHVRLGMPRSTSAEITQRATAGHFDQGRPLPQRYGLTVGGISAALQGLGYEPFVYDPTAGNGLRIASTLYSYIASDIPVIMMLDFKNEAQDRHAVLAVGFKQDFKVLNSSRSFPTSITEFYTQDDRYGPYVRMTVTNHLLETGAVLHYTTAAGDPNDTDVSVGQMIVPLPKAVHVISQEAHNWALPVLRVLAEQNGDSAPSTEQLPWITRSRLIDSNTLKSDSLYWPYEFAADQLQEQSLPLRVWVTEAFSRPYKSGDEPVARIVMDPTVLRDATGSQYLFAHVEDLVVPKSHFSNDDRS